MSVRKSVLVAVSTAGILHLVTFYSEAISAEVAPPQLIFYDGFEYEVKRDERNERPAFISQGKWSGVKSQNSRGKGLGYLYTVDRIPGYAGPFPGRNSKRVLAIEARSKTFNNQTDFYLQYGNGRGPADQIPGDVWFQFWLYVNYHDDPQDREDQLSGFGGGKFIYPSVDGNYPTHPVWLFCVGNSSKEPFWATAPVHDLFVVSPSTGAEIKTARPWNRWKLGQTSLDERIVANRWTLVKIHLDTSTASGRFEVWMKPLGGKSVKVTEWIDGVTKDFAWKIPAEKVGGYRVFRMPTTQGSFGERAKDNMDSWIYMDDFAMASSEEALPKYPD
ncbi:MAG: hypothetical protein H8E44_04670 [Planctomycetes bacterium]|nr:hypothetical protein [Planctomycetota bacterium]